MFESVEKRMQCLKVLTRGRTGRVQVRVWCADTHRCVAILDALKGPMRALSWKADGTRLASGGSDGVVRVWDPEAKVCKANRNMCNSRSPF